MATQDTIYNDIFNFFEAATLKFINIGVVKVADAIKDPAFTLLGCYIILWGLSHILGLIREPIIDATKRFIKIGFIFGIAFSMASYNAYIVQMMTEFPDYLSEVLISSGSSKAVDSINFMYTETWRIGQRFWDLGGVSAPQFCIIAIIVWCFACLISAYSAFLIILSKVAISILVALGPLFIISILFETTKKYFESWIATLSNYGVLIVLVSSFNSFLIIVFTAALEESNSGNLDKVSSAAPVVIISLISCLILSQLMQIASSVAGGISLSTMGAFRGAMGAGAKITGLRAANRYVSAKTANAAGGAVRGAAAGTYNLVKRPFVRTNTAARR